MFFIMVKMKNTDNILNIKILQTKTLVLLMGVSINSDTWQNGLAQKLQLISIPAP